MLSKRALVMEIQLQKLEETTANLPEAAGGQHVKVIW
jgi:hypothetical protein